MVLDADQPGGAAGDLVHFVLRGAAVFQRKGDVLPHRQADELAVRVLQHRADVARQLKILLWGASTPSTVSVPVHLPG